MSRPHRGESFSKKASAATPGGTPLPEYAPLIAITRMVGKRRRATKSNSSPGHARHYSDPIRRYRGLPAGSPAMPRTHLPRIALDIRIRRTRRRGPCAAADHRQRSEWSFDPRASWILQSIAIRLTLGLSPRCHFLYCAIVTTPAASPAIDDWTAGAMRRKGLVASEAASQNVIRASPGGESLLGRGFPVVLDTDSISGLCGGSSQSGRIHGVGPFLSCSVWVLSGSTVFCVDRVSNQGRPIPNEIR